MELTYGIPFVHGEKGLITVSRYVYITEDEDTYRRRLMSKDYDVETYPYYEYGFVEYPEDQPPREILHTEREDVVFTRDLVPVKVKTIDHEISWSIDRQQWLLEGNDSPVLGHKKELFNQYNADGTLYYYGTVFSPIRKDEDGVMHLGVTYIPLLTAKSGDNIQVQNNMLYHLIAMPFQHHPDLPPIKQCLQLWTIAMRTLIFGGYTSPYLRRFFGDIRYINYRGKLVGIYRNDKDTIASVTTSHEIDGTYTTYILNGRAIMMTSKLPGEELEHSIDYIEDHHIVLRDDSYGPLLPEDTPTNMSVYIGNSMFDSALYTPDTFYYNDHHQILASGGIDRDLGTYPLHDPYMLLQSEDISIYHQVVNQ